MLSTCSTTELRPQPHQDDMLKNLNPFKSPEGEAVNPGAQDGRTRPVCRRGLHGQAAAGVLQREGRWDQVWGQPGSSVERAALVTEDVVAEAGPRGESPLLSARHLKCFTPTFGPRPCFYHCSAATSQENGMARSRRPPGPEWEGH